MTEEQKKAVAKQLSEKRRVMGDTAFRSYLGKIETAIPQRRTETIAEQTKLDTDVAPKGVLGALARSTGVERMGTALGATLASKFGGSTKGLEESNQRGADISLELTKKIIAAKNEGRDTSRLEQALELINAQNESGAKAVGELATGGVTNREVIGSALRTAGTIGSAGTFGGGTTGVLSKVAAPQLTSATTVGKGIVQGAVQGLKTGAASGAVFGGISGTATGIEQGKGVLGTAFEAAKQAAVGSVVGGTVGTVAGGIGGGFQAKANRKTELTELLSRGNTVDEALSTPVASTAQKTITPAAATAQKTATQATQKVVTPSKATAGYKLEGGKVVADKPAQKLLKQGIDERNVSVMQSFSPEDTKAAREMVKIAKEVSDSGIATQRQQEVVGKAFMQRAKDVETLNRTAGGKIDDIARTQLAGQKVSAGKATDQFFNQLERDGVDIDALRLAKTSDEIAQAFEGSSYEGLSTVQRTLNTVLKRVDQDLGGAEMDGLALHRAKRFIDNQVTYGKNAEGLTGDAERLLKGLRANIDDVLDTQFPDYNAANTQYKDTIEALDEMRRLIGKDFLGSGDITNLRAGEVMNRLLGNASAKPLSALQNLENVSTKYGNKYNDSVLKQITFADLLDDVYQTVPSRGFQGGVQKGVEGAASGFLGKMRQGGFISATVDTGAEAIQAARGITPETAQKAIEEYLSLTVK